MEYLERIFPYIEEETLLIFTDKFIGYGLLRLFPPSQNHPSTLNGASTFQGQLQFQKPIKLTLSTEIKDNQHLVSRYRCLEERGFHLALSQNTYFGTRGINGYRKPNTVEHPRQLMGKENFAQDPSGPSGRCLSLFL